MPESLPTLGYPRLPLAPKGAKSLKSQPVSGILRLKIKSHLPEGPAVVPGVGPPVFRAEAHGDLEHLRVHHVGYHPQAACGGRDGIRKQAGLCAPPRACRCWGGARAPLGRTVGRTRAREATERLFSKPVKELESEPEGKGQPWKNLRSGDRVSSACGRLDFSVKNQVSKRFRLCGPLGPVATISLPVRSTGEPWTARQCPHGAGLAPRPSCADTCVRRSFGRGSRESVSIFRS